MFWSFSSVASFAGRHPGLIFVLLGVALEGVELISKWKRRHKHDSILAKEPWWMLWIESASLTLVVLGLALEIPDAGKTDKEAADIGTTNALLWQSNIVLAAELKRPARRITPEEMTNFIALLKGSPTGPVRIYVGSEDKETRNFSRQLRELLDAANCKTGDSNGIVHLGDGFFYSAIENANDIDADLRIEFFGEPDKVTYWNGLKIIPNTTNQTFIIVATNQKDVLPVGIDNAFQKIGKTVTGGTDNYFLKQGEWGIFVPEKF